MRLLLDTSAVLHVAAGSLSPPTGLDAALLCAAADLPSIHRDPFDRILVATAMRDRLTLLTPDRQIAAYPGVTTVW